MHRPLAVAYGVVASGVANLGLAVGYERNYFQYSGEHERGALLYSVLACVVATAALAGAATWIWREEIAALLTGDRAHGPLIVAGFAANEIAGVKAFYLLYFKNAQQARLHAMYSVDETVLGAVASLFFVAWLRWGPMGLLAGQLAAGGLVLLLTARRVARDVSPGWSWPLLKDTLGLSLPLTPRVFLGVLGNNFDKYLISQLATMGGVGIYTLGQRLAYVVFQFMTALGNAFTPVLYQRMLATSADVRASVGAYLTPFAWVSAAIAVAVALFAEEILWMLATPEFSGAAPVVSLLALSYGAMFFGKVPQLTVARKTWLTSVITVGSLALLVVINLYTVPRWGAVGAAAGTLTATLLTTAVTLVLGQRAFAIEWQTARLAAIFGSTACAASAAAFLPWLVEDYGARLLLKLTLGVLFVATGWRLGYVVSPRVALAQWSGRA
jgi:O-antigen/teichoic acid export membrane protein